MDILFIKSSFTGPNLTTVGSCIGGTAQSGFSSAGKQVIRVAYTPERGKALAANYGSLVAAGIYATITLGVHPSGELATVLAAMGSKTGLDLPVTTYTEYNDTPNQVVENLIVDARSMTKAPIRLYNCPGAVVRNCLIFGLPVAAVEQAGIMVSRCDGAQLANCHSVGGAVKGICIMGSSYVSIDDCSAGGNTCSGETLGVYPGAPWTYEDIWSEYWDGVNPYDPENRFKALTNLGGWIGDPDNLRLIDHGGGRYIYLDISDMANDNKNPGKPLTSRTWYIRTSEDATQSVTCVYHNPATNRVVLDCAASIPAGLVAWYCFDEEHRPHHIRISNYRCIGPSTENSSAGISLYHVDDFELNRVYAENVGDYVAGAEFCRRGVIKSCRSGGGIGNPRNVELTFHSEDIRILDCPQAGLWPQGCPSLRNSLQTEVVPQNGIWDSTSAPSATNQMLNWYDDVRINAAEIALPGFITVTNPPASTPFDPEDENIPAGLVG